MSALRFDTFDRDAAGQLIVDPAEADAQRQAAAQPAPAPEPARPLQLADVLPAVPAVAPARGARASRAGLPWLLVAAAAIVLLAVLLPSPRATPAPATTAADSPMANPTQVATAAPTATVSQPQIMARWDYRDHRNVTSITPDMIASVAGTADGGAWVLVELTNDRQLWLRSADAPAVPPNAPDLTVPTPDPIIVEVPVPVAAPPPQVCGEYGVPGQMVSACGATQAEADANGQELWEQTYAR
jgi:hypothetical protein